MKGTYERTFKCSKSRRKTLRRRSKGKHQCSQRKEIRVKKQKTQTKSLLYRLVRNPENISQTKIRNFKGKAQINRVKIRTSKVKIVKLLEVSKPLGKTTSNSSKAISRRHRRKKAKRVENTLNGKVVRTTRSSRILEQSPEASIKRSRR